MALRFMSDDEDSDMENSFAQLQLELKEDKFQENLRDTMSSSGSPSLLLPLAISQHFELQEEEHHQIQWSLISPVHSESPQSPVVSEYEEDNEKEEEQQVQEPAPPEEEENNDPIHEEKQQEPEQEQETSTPQQDEVEALKAQLDSISPEEVEEEPGPSLPLSQSDQVIQEILGTSNQTRWGALKAKASSSGSMVLATAVAVKRRAFSNGSSTTNSQRSDSMADVYGGDFSSDDEDCCEQMRPSSFDYDERNAGHPSRKFNRRTSFRFSTSSATSTAVAAARISVCNLQEVIKKRSSYGSRTSFMRFRTQSSSTASTCSDRVSTSSTSTSFASHQLKTRASLCASKAVEMAQSVSKQKAKQALSVVDSATRNRVISYL